MKTKCKILFFFLVLYTGAIAQDNTDKLEKLFSGLHQNNQFNGNVLVADNGKIVYQKSFGFANISNNLLNNDSSAFTLGSVSKTLTSTAILQLKDKGKLKLDDYIKKYFPDFPYPNITIRHLLSHTSGLPDYDLYEEQIDKNPNKIFSNKDILPSLTMWKKPLLFTPGEKWKYSNTNFCLLALLAEKLSGTAFKKYIQQFILTPAKMNHTYFLTDTIKIPDVHRTINYDYPWLFSTTLQPVDSSKKYRWRLYNVSGFTGQGNIITTAQDLLLFDQLLYSGKIIKQTTLNEAFTPTKLNNGQNTKADIGLGKSSYGLGWFIFDDTLNGKIVWHTGGEPGSLSIFIRNITKRQTVIAFDNAFNTTLYRNGVNAMNILNDGPVIIQKKSLVQAYGMALVNGGADFAFCKLSVLSADSLHYYLSEGDINDLGLQLLYEASFDKHKELSLEVLKINILLFPNSFNTYDSYGEALANVGKKEEAIIMYKKSLELNPDNEGGKKAIEELMKK